MEVLALTALTALISSVVAAIVGALVSKLKTTTKEAAENREIQRQTLMMICRIAIYDEHFTVDEKLDAYEIYRDAGGNHQTKKYMDELVGSDVDDYIEKHRKKD